MPAPKEEVEDFLKLFRKYWPPACFVVPREKNDDALCILGITAKHRQSEIMSLTYKNCRKGPEPDEDGSSGDIWKFCKKIKGTEVYIKLKIYKVERKTYAKCLSFHH